MDQMFNALEFEPTQGVETWPNETWCKVRITETDVKAVKNKDNAGYILLTIVGLEPEAVKGKIQFIRLNRWNDNQTAVDMANRELSAIVRVTLGAHQGRFNYNNTNELCNLDFYAFSRVTPGENGRSNQNFGMYKDLDGNDAGKQTGQPLRTPNSGGLGGPGGAPQFGGPAMATVQQQPQQQPQFAAAAPVQQAPAGFGAPQQQQAPTFAQPAPQQPQPGPGAWSPGGPAQPQQFAQPAPGFGQQQPQQQQQFAQPQQFQQPAPQQQFAPAGGPGAAPPWKP